MYNICILFLTLLANELNSKTTEMLETNVNININSKYLCGKSGKSDSSSLGSDEAVSPKKENLLQSPTPSLVLPPAFRTVNVESDPMVHQLTDIPEIKMSSAIKDRSETPSISNTSESCKTNEMKSLETASSVEDPQPILTMLEQRAAKKGKVLKHTRTESPVTHWKQHKNYVTNIGFAVAAVSFFFLISALVVTIVYFIERNDEELTSYPTEKMMIPDLNKFAAENLERIPRQSHNSLNVIGRTENVTYQSEGQAKKNNV